MSLVRDIANPSTQDPYFPITRHKDWWMGHSWAAGLFDFADSKDQESSSEATNAYYGIYLLGLAMQNNDLADFGRVLLATEIRSTHTYWHISTLQQQIYPPLFAANKIVGIVWSDKVDYATWFGGNVEYIHGIQMLPFTPITEQLLSAPWVAQEYPVVAVALNRTDPPLGESWRGFIYMDWGIINPSAAWTAAQTLTSYDDGNSQTNTLYWLATRP